ncbi:hypothetical protein BCR39DRAFT_533746 [Naematelia encephala]|uniref:GLTSCR protein conserved domain-containing protein n=1 Tax=Naematelia encephala TaxID=71784 RepID=A0A1Y2B1P4_9TREE|nr:hypothetical protein BCR39DRAFT_533746 [Naematelia encephala]
MSTVDHGQQTPKTSSTPLNPSIVVPSPLTPTQSSQLTPNNISSSRPSHSLPTTSNKSYPLPPIPSSSSSSSSYPIPSSTTTTTTSRPIASTATSRPVPSTTSTTSRPVPSVPTSSISTSHQQPSSNKRKRPDLTPDESLIASERSTTLALALAQDQLDTLYPSPEALDRFKNLNDAVARLVPWHLWSYGEGEGELEGSGERAKKAQERDLAESADLLRRMATVNKRFLAVRQREGRHPSPLPVLISLINDSTASVRSEIGVLGARVSAAKAQYEGLESRRREGERVRVEMQRRKEEAEAAAVAAALERGKPRGRPRGRGGRPGANLPVVTHASSAAATKPPSQAPQGPVQITVALGILPQLVQVGVLNKTNVGANKTPGQVIRATEDKKSAVLSIHLGACTPPQLATLAKLLNVKAASDESSKATPPGTPSTSTSDKAQSAPARGQNAPNKPDDTSNKPQGNGDTGQTTQSTPNGRTRSAKG